MARRDLRPGLMIGLVEDGGAATWEASIQTRARSWESHVGSGEGAPPQCSRARRPAGSARSTRSSLKQQGGRQHGPLQAAEGWSVLAEDQVVGQHASKFARKKEQSHRPPLSDTGAVRRGSSKSLRSRKCHQARAESRTSGRGRPSSRKAGRSGSAQRGSRRLAARREKVVTRSPYRASSPPERRSPPPSIRRSPRRRPGAEHARGSGGARASDGEPTRRPLEVLRPNINSPKSARHEPRCASPRISPRSGSRRDQRDAPRAGGANPGHGSSRDLRQMRTSRLLRISSSGKGQPGDICTSRARPGLVAVLEGCTSAPRPPAH